MQSLVWTGQWRTALSQKYKLVSGRIGGASLACWLELGVYKLLETNLLGVGRYTLTALWVFKVNHSLIIL